MATTKFIRLIQKPTLTLTGKVYRAAKKFGAGGLAECGIIFLNMAIRPNLGIAAARIIKVKRYF